jgi:hypothetical protein
MAMARPAPSVFTPSDRSAPAAPPPWTAAT